MLLRPVLSPAALLLLSCAGALGAEPGFRPLFNGRDLTAWQGDAKFWSVKDGVIRGETTLTALTFSNTFLIWQGGVLKDFELRVKFRIQNGNSGIQYRSNDLGGFSVSGYQAEIENTQGKVGFLYEERGRKFLANVGEKVRVNAGGKREITGSLSSKQTLIDWDYYKEKEWNEYRIVARGNRLEHYLNGFQTIEFVDDEVPKRALEGILALQIHAGLPMLVEFKDILLREF